MTSGKNFTIGFRTGFERFGNNINLIVNTLLLSTVYFIGVGFTYVVAKLVNKSFLDVATSKKTDTYWSDLRSNDNTIEECYRLF